MAVEGFMAKGPPPMAKWLFFLQIGICVLCLAVLIAAAINVDAFDDWSYYTSTSGPGGFLIFDVIFTWIIIGTMIGFSFYAPHFYIRLTYVVTLVLASIFWLSSWAWAASIASAFRTAYDGRMFKQDSLDKYGSSMVACAVLGAFTWVAVTVLAVYYILACFHHDESTAGTPATEMQGTKAVDPEAGVGGHAPPPAGAYDETGLHQNPYQTQGVPPPQQQQQQQQQQTPYPVQETPQAPNTAQRTTQVPLGGHREV